MRSPLHAPPLPSIAARFHLVACGATILSLLATLAGQTAPVIAPLPAIANDSAWSGATPDFTHARSLAGAARLTNISIRARAGSGASTLIAGAAIQGNGSLPLLVRAIGGSLGQFGVKNALSDPRLQLYRGDALAAQTGRVASDAATAAAYVGAFPLTEFLPSIFAYDAALVGEASAGTLTAHCSSFSGQSGIALLEFYDAAPVPGAAARFTNLSSRAQVDAGDGILVVGFVVAGEGNVTLLLRGIGVSLEQFGVTGVLRDPMIELFSGATRIASNDNWRTADTYTAGRLEAARISAGAFALTSSIDAALVVTLPAGAYTLQLHGVGGQTGIALAEIHDLGANDFDPAFSNNAVGLDLYRQLLGATPPPNLIISPYSIESALALAYAGADGGTREEMARVLRLPADDDALQAGFAGLRHALEQSASNTIAIATQRTQTGKPTTPIEWNAANRLFGPDGFSFRNEFLSLMRDGFEAPFTSMDFIGAAETSRRAINTWVEEQTHDRIIDLIPEGALDASTRLVLVNALYLKAPWDVPFEKAGTIPRAFHLTANDSVDVPTMYRAGSMGYAAEDGLTVVTLDYLGGELQFVVVLPDRNVDVDTAAQRLTPAHFARWAKLSETGRKLVQLYLPKFKVPSATISLSPALDTLGMHRAFTDDANFSRIATLPPGAVLKISNVFHQTFVAVEEEATEAAAATAVVVTIDPSINVAPTDTPFIEVRVDRPFLFAIQHKASTACVFLGRVNDPR